MKYETAGDHSDDAGALSYAYQFHCPNDQNLIAVLGRELGPGTDPQSAPGTGWGPQHRAAASAATSRSRAPAQADDVIIEAGKAEAGNGGPSGIGHVKDVGIRADRADGFVLSNFTIASRDSSTTSTCSSPTATGWTSSSPSIPGSTAC